MIAGVKVLASIRVSVSLRSIVHSYNINDMESYYIELKVSVSLRSIVHSYYNVSIKLKGVIKMLVSVSLRSIVHSY